VATQRRAVRSRLKAAPRAFAVPTLAADRVTLRPLCADDVYALFGFFSDREVARYWSRPPMTHLTQARALLRQIREGYRSGETVQFGIERNDDKVLVGTCTLFHIHAQSRRAEVGYALGSPYWGQGYMHEALQRLLRYAFESSSSSGSRPTSIRATKHRSARCCGLGFVQGRLSCESDGSSRRGVRLGGLRIAEARMAATVIRRVVPIDAAAIAASTTATCWRRSSRSRRLGRRRTMRAPHRELERRMRGSSRRSTAASPVTAYAVGVAAAIAYRRSVETTVYVADERSATRRRTEALRRAAARARAARLSLRDGRDRAAERGKRRAARAHGLCEGRPLPRGGMESSGAGST
jgi:hypothetical protein